MLTLALLTAAVGVLLGFAAGAAYGGRHTAGQSRRADREKQRADKAERTAALNAMAAHARSQQITALRKALGSRTARRAVDRA